MSETASAVLGPDELVYLEKVRHAMRRLSSRDAEPDNIALAAQAVRDLSVFDPGVPTASRRRELELVKTGLKRLMAFYIRYLVGQLNAFGANVARMGEALVVRTERLEATADDLVARMGAAEERLARLEAVNAESDHPASGKGKGAASASAATNGRRPAGASRGTNRPRSNRRKQAGQ